MRQLRPHRQRPIIQPLCEPIGDPLQAVLRHAGLTLRICVQPVANQVAAAGGDGSIKLFNTALERGFPIANWGSIRGKFSVAVGISWVGVGL